MKKRKYTRRFAALLLALFALAAFTTSGSAYAFTYEQGGLPHTTHYSPGEYYYPPYETEFAPEEYPYYAQSYEWHKLVTGNFYSLNLLTTEYDVMTAIIHQSASCSGFYATSVNSTNWTITGPVTVHVKYELIDYEYVPVEYLYEPAFLDLSEAGLIRIERLPYQLDDGIKWIGYAIMQNTAGDIWREQIRIIVGGEWINPHPPELTLAISDLQGFSWGREAIEFVVARNLMDMYLCDETHEFIAFDPSGDATRGYVLAAAVKALGLSVPYFSEAVHTPFYDVPLTGRGVYVDIAKQLGLVVGVGNNLFAPDRTITRQDMMTMLYNIMMSMGQIQPDVGLTALGRFSDFADISSYARLPISSLAKAGIIAGDGVSINPRGYVTRVEAAMFVRNLYRVGE